MQKFSLLLIPPCCCISVNRISTICLVCWEDATQAYGNLLPRLWTHHRSQVSIVSAFNMNAIQLWLYISSYLGTYKHVISYLLLSVEKISCLRTILTLKRKGFMNGNLPLSVIIISEASESMISSHWLHSFPRHLIFCFLQNQFRSNKTLCRVSCCGVQLSL